jgi:hypothetical protein
VLSSINYKHTSFTLEWLQHSLCLRLPNLVDSYLSTAPVLSIFILKITDRYDSQIRMQASGKSFTLLTYTARRVRHFPKQIWRRAAIHCPGYV